MNRKKKIVILIALISFAITPSLVSGIEYDSFKIGDSYYWTIKIEGTLSLILNPDQSVNKNLYLKAQILEITETVIGIPSYVTNFRIAPSFVGSDVAFNDYWNSAYLGSALNQKLFYLFGMLFIPLEYTSSLSYVDYLDNNGFDLITTSSSSILTYETYTGISHTLKYDNKGILDSYVRVSSGNQISVKRALSVGGIIGLGVGGLVLIIGLIALTVVLVRRRRRAASPFAIPEKSKIQPIQRFQERTYPGTSPSAHGAPRQTVGAYSEGTPIQRFTNDQFKKQFLTEASFVIIILLFLLLNDTIISRSFYLGLTEITHSYDIWDIMAFNYSMRLYTDVNIFTIILCIITLIFALIFPLDLDKGLSQEELAKNILLKISFLLTSIFSLVSFIIQSSVVSKLFDEFDGYDEFESLLLKYKTAYTFEFLAFMILLMTLCIMPFIYKNSDIFSFFKPAFYVLSLGLIFFIIAGFIASSFYEKLVLDLFLTDESALSQYRTGAIFVEIAYFLMMLSLMIWMISIARKRGSVIFFVTIVITSLTGLFEFLDSYLLLQYNLSEIYFEMVLYEDVVQRHQAYSSIASILFLFVIFLGIVLRLQSSTDLQTAIPRSIARRRFTHEERMQIASTQPYQHAPSQTREDAEIRHEQQGQSEILEPIRISLCPHCKEVIEEDSQFCRHCGVQLSIRRNRGNRS